MGHDMGLFNGDRQFIDVASIRFTSEIMNIIAEIDTFKGAWSYLSILRPERLRALKKIATIESIGSSTRIEGAKLTDEEVELLLTKIEKESFTSRDEEEVAGYAYVCEQIYLHYDHLPLTENVIRQLHTWLLKFSVKDRGHLGSYKNIPIRIEAFNAKGISIGTIFETSSPFETPLHMEELLHWTNTMLAKRVLHPLIVIALFIVVFLAIHPFQDGNGRLSRLLTTLMMLRSGYAYVPYSSLESIIEANKESYYLALQQSQRRWREPENEWLPWLEFFLHCILRQKQHLEQKIFLEKQWLSQFSPAAIRVMECIKEHGVLSISEIATLTAINRNTLKKILSQLVAAKALSMNGKGKGIRYSF